MDTTGSAATSGGKSHSWLRPTSASPSPTAATISVAEGSRDTMRTRLGYATIAAMSLYDRVADLELVIDDHRYERLEQATRRFTRVSTVVVLAGRGEEGRGEDVIYEPGAHDALPDADLRGTHTIRSLSARLDAMDLFPGVDEVPAMWQAMADYRRWAFESAALDLALRQEGCSLGTLLGLEYRPVRFCVSAGDPEEWLKHDPDARVQARRDAGLEPRVHGAPAGHRPRRLRRPQVVLRGHGRRQPARPGRSTATSSSPSPTPSSRTPSRPTRRGRSWSPPPAA